MASSSARSGQKDLIAQPLAGARQGDASEAVARAIGGRRLRPEQLVDALHKPRKQIVQTLGRMILSGYVERDESGRYRLTAEGRTKVEKGERFRPGPRGPLGQLPGPKADTLRQRAWNAMRIRKRFTVDDLATLAARAGDKVPRDNLQHFLKALERGGYVSARPTRAKESAAPGSNGCIVWRLEKDTGPFAPRVAWDRASLFDHNTQERVTWERETMERVTWK